MAESKAPSFATSYLQPYHIVNCLLLVTVPIVRCTSLNELFFDIPRGLSPEETQAYSFLGVVLAIKARRIASTDAYLASVFSLAKVAIAYVLFRLETAYFIFYILACVAGFLFFPAPVVDKNHQVTLMTPQRLENVLNSSREGRKNAFVLVMYAAAWSGASNLMGRDFANLSSKYSNGPIRFVKIDIGQYPDVAAKRNISTSTLSKQLPTFILFRNGVEVRRRPRVVDGTVYACRFNQEILEQDFQVAEIDSGAFDTVDVFAEEGSVQETDAEDRKTK